MSIRDYLAYNGIFVDAKIIIKILAILQFAKYTYMTYIKTYIHAYLEEHSHKLL